MTKNIWKLTYIQLKSYIYICDSTSLFLGYTSESFSFNSSKNFFDMKSVILTFQMSTADLKSKA